MQGNFTNRQGMFHTSLDTLNEDEHKLVWQGKAPEIFEVKVGQAALALKDLDDFCRQHGSDITGITADKAREEKEAVAVAVTMAGLLFEWFQDKNDLTNATKVDLTQRAFRALRDQEEVGKLREVRDIAKGLSANDDPAVVAAAAKYGITADAVNAVDKEVEEYAAAVNAPSTSISQHTALTRQLRDRFNAVEAKFASLDNLIGAFNGTPAGRAFIAAYESARGVRDLGGGHKTAVVTPTP